MSSNISRVRGVLDAVQALSTADAAVEFDGLPDAVLAEQALSLRSAAERLEAAALARLAQFDARGAAAEHGLSTTGWWSWRTRSGAGAARRDVVLARRLRDELPATAAGLRDGALTRGHAGVISSAVSELPAPVTPDAERLLASQAEILTVPALRTAAVHLRARLDPDGDLARADRIHANRWLDVAATFGGAVHVAGLLDAEAGETLLAALHPLATPTGPDDERTAAQRRADALTDLAARALQGGELPVTGGHRPQVSVVVDLPTLLSGLDIRGADISLRAPAVTPESGLPSGARTAWAGPLAIETVRRILCDAGVNRAIFDGPGEILDLGRTVRTATPAQRKALALRDGGCIGPGCTRPPDWCDAHHRTPWILGGRTDVAEMVLLCRRHHRLVHEGGWSAQRGADGRYVLCPPERRRTAA